VVAHHRKKKLAIVRSGISGVIAGALDHQKMQLDQTLQTLQHLPAPFISSFVLIHLSAPILANVGGSNVASQVMVSCSF
jgi:hypothetical protein